MHLSARRSSVRVHPPVKLIQHIQVKLRTRADRLAWRSHTHHQDLMTLGRLAHNKSIILQVRHHWHRCRATAAAPAPSFPPQSSSQQSRARHAGGGGFEQQRNSRGLQNWAAWRNLWPGEVKIIISSSISESFPEYHANMKSVYSVDT